MADTFLKKIRNCLEDIKVIFTIVVFFMGATGLGAKEYMKKSDQLESATHAVKTMSGLIHENKEKIVSHETRKVIHKTVIDNQMIHKLEKRIDEIEKQIPPNHTGFH